MKTKTLPVVVLTAILILSLAATPCWAHGKKWDTLEAVTIAAGAAVLINALVSPGYYSPQAVCLSPTVVYVSQPRPSRHGHWRPPQRHYHKPWHTPGAGHSPRRPGSRHKQP